MLLVLLAACNPSGKNHPEDNPSPPIDDHELNALPQVCSVPCNYTDSLIPVDTATIWLNAYRDQFPNAPIAFYFKTEEIVSLLDQSASDGFRLYFSVYDEETEYPQSYFDRMRLLMVPVLDTNDLEPDTVLGFDPEFTFNLGTPNILHHGISTQQFSNLAGAGLVPYAEAASMTAAWRAGQAENGFTLQSYTFCLDWMCYLLENSTQPTRGLRFYVGLDPHTMHLRLVSVAVDGQGNDIIQDQYGVKMVDWSAPCPEICGQPSGMNS